MLHPGGTNGSERPARLLLAEDDRELRFILATVLAQAGFEVVEAADGAEAMAALAPELLGEGCAGFDVVVSDHLMPGVTGLELLEALREAGLPTPFILTTGQADESVRRRAAALRVAAVFQKPVELLTLVSAAQGCLQLDTAMASVA